jgi:hypothetical protein
VIVTVTNKMPVVQRVTTSRLAWSGVLAAGLVALLGRLPVLRSHVRELLASNASVTADLTDAHLRNLAVNVGLALAVVVSILLLFLYQSLARALERHVFSPSWSVGSAKLGLFFVISTLCTIPGSVFCAVRGSISLRDNALFYAYVLGVSVASPLLYRRHWCDLSHTKVATLYVCATTFGFMSTMI